MNLSFPSDQPRLPGSFTICQGTPGDGMRNTMDIPPTLTRRQAPGRGEPARQEGADSRERRSPWTVLQHREQKVISSKDPSLPVCDHEVTSTTSQEDSVEFIRELPYNEEDFLGSTIQQHSEDPLKEVILREWEQDCRCSELQNREAWLQAICDKKSCITEWPDTWWAPEHGLLAVFPSILDPHRTTQPCPLSSLSPGSIVTGVQLFTQRCTDGQLIKSPYKDLENGTRIYRRGRPGVIQWLQISSPVQGYIVYSIDGYSVALPGLPDVYSQPTLWLWRVVCPSGAFVRQGQDLSTDHIGTVPYGSIVQVKRKLINAMGLPRIEISASIEDEKGSSHIIHGWCSEYLNPLSGQSGFILRPLPLPAPILCQLTSNETIVRESFEEASRVVGTLTRGDNFTVVGRCFAEFPADNCAMRCKLAGKEGWISFYGDGSDDSGRCVPQFETSGQDSSFHPDNPGEYHISCTNKRNMDCSWDDESSLCSEILNGPTQGMKENGQTSSGGVGAEKCLVCLSEERTATLVHGETGHIACCLMCARILKARKDPCPVCRLPIDLVVQHFWA